jgi:alpha-galactosidase
LIHHLRASGTSLVLDARGTKVPQVLHWGADLGELSQHQLAALAEASVPAIPPSSIDEPLRLSLLPSIGEGWSGRPAVTGFRPGSGGAAGLVAGTTTFVFVLRGVDVGLDAGNHTLTLQLADAAASVSLTTELELTEHGVIRLRHTLTNDGNTRLSLGSLDLILPLPERAREVLDFSGLWTHERRPQRTTLAHGLWARETRHGRPGHDDPFLTVAGLPGFGFRAGEVWALHFAWSGDKRVWVERSALGRATLGAGELLEPGELSLAPGENYSTPWAVAVYSADGLDGLSARLHPWIRSWSTITAPRPVVLNTWEAVYFDHDLPTLTRLVEAAAEVGVERFVLDDGWFAGRTDDRRALGDWFVDQQKWPSGLTPLIDRVLAAGMDFGLWVEPEMVSDDSELAQQHPDWILGSPDAPTWRFQRVLDLGNPEAFAYVLGCLNALLTEYSIAYLKWDHNRDLLAGSAHRQTSALYRLMDAVRAAHPGVEIESCASGGARIDLGILERVDRVWTSDTNDPLERQQIQRYTSILIPPEYLGGHLGAERAHTTGRKSELSFRLATALFGSAGIEWDLTTVTAEERTVIADWVRQYKRLRSLLHAGIVVRSDSADSACELHGVVAPDGLSAVFSYVALAAARTAVPAPLRFEGLHPELIYTVRALILGTPPLEATPRMIQDAPPPWLAVGGVTLTGAVLERVGIAAPLLAPEQALVLVITADADADADADAGAEPGADNVK